MSVRGDRRLRKDGEIQRVRVILSSTDKQTRSTRDLSDYEGQTVRTILIINFAGIGCLDLQRDTHEGASQRIFGRSEQHLLFDLSVIGRPGWVRKKKKGGEKFVITAGCGP